MSGDKGRSASTLTTSRSDDRMQILSQEYRSRLDSLHLQIAQIHKSLHTDELLQTMRKDPTTAQFLADRANELIESALLREQENTIQKLVNELAGAKAEVKRLESQLEDREKAAFDASDSLRISPSSRVTEDFELRLHVATKELARARSELNSEIENSASLRTANSILETKLQALEVTVHRTLKDSADLDQVRRDCEDRVRLAASENQDLRRQLDAYEKEMKELEGKYLAYSGEFKELVTASIGRQTQTYKEKSQQFKHKIVKQRESIRMLEDTVARLKGELDTVSVQKQQLETQNTQLNSQLLAQTAATQQLSRDYELKSSELSLSLQTTLESRLSVQKSHYEDLLAAAKAKETHLLATLEAKIADFQSNYLKTQVHEEILAKEIDKVRKKMSEEKILLEKDINGESISRITAMRTEFAEEKKRAAGRVADLEAEKGNLLSRNRDLERQLDEADSRIRELNSRLAKSTVEVESLTERLAVESAKVSESSLALQKLKDSYDKEYSARLRLESEVAHLQADLSDSISKTDELNRAFDDSKLQLVTKIKKLNAEVDQFARERDELIRDLRQAGGRNQVLEEEKAQTLQRLSKSSQEQISTLERLREKEKMSLMAEADALNHTKAVLSSQIEALRRELSIQKLRDKSLLSSIVKEYKTQLRELKRNLVRELTDFHHTLSDSLTDAVGEVDKHQAVTERRVTQLLNSSKDLITSLHSEKESLQDQSLNYEQRIRSLESLLLEMRTQVEGKTNELESVLGKLEYFREREQSATEGLETWKSASFAAEEKSASLKDRLLALEKVVDSLRARNEENMRYFDREIAGLAEKYRQNEERRNTEIAKNSQRRVEETQRLDAELKTMKSATVGNWTALESDLTVLLRTIQTESQRQQGEVQRLRAESEQQADLAKRLRFRIREESERAEQAEKRGSMLEAELREAKDDLVRLQLREVRTEMERTEAVVRESKERASS